MRAIFSFPSSLWVWLRIRRTCMILVGVYFLSRTSYQTRNSTTGLGCGFQWITGQISTSCLPKSEEKSSDFLWMSFYPSCPISSQHSGRFHGHFLSCIFMRFSDWIIIFGLFLPQYLLKSGKILPDSRSYTISLTVFSFLGELIPPPFPHFAILTLHNGCFHM